MAKKQALIKFTTNRNIHPHYYDYATAVQHVKNILKQKIGTELNLYHAGEDVHTLFETMHDMINENDVDVEILASVYDNVSAHTIKFTIEKNYYVIPSISNNVYYFRKYDVAMVRMPIYQNHEDFEEDFIFAKNDESLIRFINEMIAMQRQSMMKGITVFTDTDEGVVRHREKITQQIPREEVLLSEHIKRDIFRAIDEFFLKSGEFFKQYNIPYKRGILLYGNPGNGKTTLVKSIAGSVAAPIVYWQITENTSSYSIQEIFETVTKMAPMILVIEDIESMPDYARSAFLNALDGATSKEGIFLIGTTNYPERIDPALINRAGRFDRAYEIKQPDESLRCLYLEKKGIKQFLDEERFLYLVDKTKGLSIAQLNEVYMSIALQWHYEEPIDIDQIVQDLLENHRRTVKQEWDSDDYIGKVGF